MKEITYTPTGVCAKQINFKLENDIIKEVEIIGGCDGNSKGVASLVQGMEIKDVIKRLEGITCRSKKTSCPDQLAKALTELN